MHALRQSLPPSATPDQFLRLFVAQNARQAPALAYAWTAPGQAGGFKNGVLTAATDGETACVWTAGRVGYYKGWAALSAFGDSNASPLQQFRPLFKTSTDTPLAMLEPVQGRGCYQIHILGSVAWLDPRHVWALLQADACHVGHSTRPVVNGRHEALSVRAVVGGRLFRGVIKCLPALPPKAKNLKPMTVNLTDSTCEILLAPPSETPPAYRRVDVSERSLEGDLAWDGLTGKWLALPESFQGLLCHVFTAVIRPILSPA